VTPPWFPLREGVRWNYSATDPMSCRLVTVRVRSTVEIEVGDMVTTGVRRERAWVLEESDGERPHFVIEREHGVEFVRPRRFGKPEREAVVVTEDYRWGGAETWSHPVSHYVLGTRHYRRAGDEEVIVSAGRFRCLRILIDEGETGTVWLAPGVGIVRSVGVIEGLSPDRFSVLELHRCDLR